MKNAKQILSFFIIAVLIVATFSGCKKDGSQYESSYIWEYEDEDGNGGNGDTNNGGNGDTNNGGNGGAVDKDGNPTGGGTTAKTEDNVTTAGFPIAKKETTLRVLCTSFPLHVNGFDSMAFNKDYQKKTNVKIKWELMETSQNEKIVSTMAAGNYPDVIIAYNTLRASQVQKYGESGAFLQLTPSDLNKWAPNAWAAINSTKTVLNAVTFSNGKIYSLPSVRSDWGHELYSSKMYINKTWLDNLGLSVPKNYRDFLTVMEAFVKQDPNGNGINDEIGLAMNGANNMLVGGPQGIEVSGANNGYMYLNSKGEVKYFYASEEYRSSIKFLNKLKKMGALDWNTFTNVNEVRETVGTGKVGCFIAANGCTIIPEKMLSNYTIMAPIAADSTSTPIVPTNRGTEVMPYNFVITASAAKSQKKEIALRWIDYFYTPEGYIYKEYGPNGYVQEINKKGTHSLTTTTQAGSVVAKYTDNERYKFTPGYVIPGWDYGTEKIWSSLEDLYPNFKITASAKFFNDIDKNLAINTYKNYHSKKYIPYYAIKLTSSEETKVSNFNSTLQKYARDQINVFVSGTQDIDTNWSTYQKELERLGVTKAEQLYQAAYDRTAGK